MTKLRKSGVGILAFVATVAASSSLRAGTAVVIQPVSASGQHTIIGTDIFLPSGPQRLRFEVRIAGWRDRLPKTIQVRLETSGFGAGAEPLTTTSIACPSNNSAGHGFCASQLGTGSRCQWGCGPGSTSGCKCDWAFQHTSRTDYAGFGLDHISAVDISNSNARFGMTLQFDVVQDVGSAFYFGTFFVEVPAGADGIYPVGFVPSESFILEDGFPAPRVPIDLFWKARVIIAAPHPPASRTVPYVPDEPGVPTAVRVSVNSMYLPGPPVAEDEDRDFSSAQGAVYWLGPPVSYPDAAPGSTFTAASLQCTPHFADWGSLGLVHVYGAAIAPSSEYRFIQVSEGCEDPEDPLCFGPPQTLHTGQWGDVVEPFASSDTAAQPDALDIAALLDSFRGSVTVATRPMTQLRGAAANPENEINFFDIRLAADAFRGAAYPYAVPALCP